MIRNFDIYLAGGAVRDELMGISHKDLDFAVIARFDPAHADALFVEPVFEDMVRWLAGHHGVKIFTTKPEFVTARGIFPKDHPDWPGEYGDFTLGRREGPYSDGRHPDWVKLGGLVDDQARRDLTINSMVRNSTGELIDPHGGQADLERKILRFVGDAHQRISEDPLRVLRLLRFMVTKGFSPDPVASGTIHEPWVAERLAEMPGDRREGELKRMFDFDTIGTLDMLEGISERLRNAIFAPPVRLTVTQRKVKKHG